MRRLVLSVRIHIRQRHERTKENKRSIVNDTHTQPAINNDRKIISHSEAGASAAANEGYAAQRVAMVLVFWDFMLELWRR